MSPGFKLFIPCALALYFASACAPDLDSLSANYSSSAGSSNSDGGSNSNGGGSPTTDTCLDGKKNSGESDIDCGGTSKCDRCVVRASCTKDGDCQSDYCKDKVCTKPTCEDGVQNQEETAIDCGGPNCDACDTGTACQTDDDCSGKYCVDLVCGDHCTSDKKEADETDVNCGGLSCDPCDDGKKCIKADDCKSAVCSNQKCQPARCDDHLQNQDESDEDCGGVCATEGKACAATKVCNSGADCESWVCSKAGRCVNDIVVAPEAMIDDFEDGDFFLPVPPKSGRVGNWYAYGDTTGIASEDVFAIKRGASINGLHTIGKDFKMWGSGVGVDLKNPGSGPSTKLPTDASAFSGITFWARSATGAPMLTLVVPDVNTDPAGGVCDVPGMGCDHHYYKSLTLSTAWQRYSVLFTDLLLETGGKPEAATGPFTPNAITAVQFRVPSGAPYDLYFDDVAFLAK